MRLPQTRTLVATALVAGAALPVAAQAEMEVAMQDDQAVIYGTYNRDLALTQFQAMGGNHVRINVVHPKGGSKDTSFTNTTLLDGAVDAVVAKGLTPQLTLFWREKSPKLQAAWMKNVVAHFGDRVNRYSISNEPDLYITEDKPCTKNVIKGIEKQFKSQFVKQHGLLRAKVITAPKGVAPKDACLRYERGVTYNKVAKAAVPAIHSANPNAQILGGETSPNKGLDWFFKSAKPSSLGVDGWAHHPFQFQSTTPSKPSQVWGIGRLPQLKKAVRMPIYLTEFGYPHPDTEMDQHYYGGKLTEASVAKANVAAWKLARKQGARQMLQYQWYIKPSFRTELFDTSILNKDDGSSTPMYDALAAYIHSW
jgi:hypothetical protein